MKRNTLILFILVITAMTVMPTVRPRAQKRDKVMKPPLRLPISREMQMKECKMRDAYGGSIDSASYARELSRQTREITAALPAPQSAERPLLLSAKSLGKN